MFAFTEVDDLFCDFSYCLVLHIKVTYLRISIGKANINKQDQ